jgi:hypothetical protein
MMFSVGLIMVMGGSTVLSMPYRCPPNRTRALATDAVLKTSFYLMLP